MSSEIFIIKEEPESNLLESGNSYEAPFQLGWSYNKVDEQILENIKCEYDSKVKDELLEETKEHGEYRIANMIHLTCCFQPTIRISKLKPEIIEAHTISKTKKKYPPVDSSSKKIFHCEICGYKSSIKHSVQRHNLSHSKQKQIMCQECDYKTTTLEHLKRHILYIHTDTKSYECESCELQFKTQGDLRIHERTHYKIHPFQCSYCGCKCNSNYHLKTHLRIHTGEKPFKCKHCEYSSCHKGSLSVHVRIHSDDKPHKCSQCEYRSNSKRNLKVHELIHSQDKKFGCDKCNYTCIRKGDLARHALVHSTDKPVHCDKCEFVCKTAYSLRAHQLTHIKKKQLLHNKKKETSKVPVRQTVGFERKFFNCKQCAYKSKSNYSLKRHMLMHTGEKPHSCPLCDFRCSIKNNLRMHLLTHCNEKRLGSMAKSTIFLNQLKF